MGTKSICKYINTNNSLTSLDLGNNSVMDEGAKIIATSLFKNVSLKKLLLYDNNIGPDGAKHLALMLKSNPFNPLLFLDLQLNKISDKGSSKFEKCLVHNQNIVELHIQLNGIIDKQIKYRIEDILDLNLKSKKIKVFMLMVFKFEPSKFPFTKLPKRLYYHLLTFLR